MYKVIPVMALTLLPAAAFGQPTSFTYQGQLKRQGLPVTGLVDMRFSLFAGSSGGSPVAGPLVFNGSPRPAVSVTNGLFSVELDFGPDAFQAGAQWLLIEVRSPHSQNNTGAYTILNPRQHITAAPFALSVPGIATSEEGVEVAGDIHTPGEVIASAFSSNSPLIFKVNPGDMECARFEDDNCYLGLGTTNPQARLHIAGVPGVDGIRFPDGSLQTTAAGVGAGGFWSASGANIFNNNGGNVGIGTPIPASRLDIVGQDGLRITGYQPFLTLTDSNNANRRARIQAVDGNFINFFTEPSFATAIPPFQIRNDGVVVVGQDAVTAVGYQPFMTLSDANAGYARSRIQGANGHVGLMTEAYIGSGGANPGAGLLFLENGSGKLGIGTGYPTAKLDVRGHLTLDPGVSPTLYTAASGGEQNRYLQLINSPSSPSASGLKAGGILVADSYSYANPGKNDLVAKGNITAGGNMSCKVLTVTGADVAEKFPSNEERVEPGTVMEIDPEHAGKLRVAREPYSSRVAGVVSGAGDLPAGAVLGSSPGNEDAPAIALTGRVWVQCDAAGAAIAAGDLLTTSSNPGFAMKASDRERSHGAVLGKAMTTLAQGDRGLVLVLVNLQ